MIEIDSKFIHDIVAAIKDNHLVMFIGSGISQRKNFPSWNQYVSELCDYWINNLSYLIVSNSVENKINPQDIALLGVLEQGKELDKKRIIDLVQQLIRKYTRRQNSNNSIDDEQSKMAYKRHVLDAEKQMFSSKGTVESDEVIEELGKLHPTFVTTNFDNILEKSLGKEWQSFHNLRQLTNDNPTFPVQSIIHMHGDINSNDADTFINSGRNYANLYLGNRKDLGKITKVLSGEGTRTVIFLGYSMQENEVLSLLRSIDNNQNDRHNYYALINSYKKTTISKKIQELNDGILFEQWGVKTVRYGKTDELDTYIKKLLKKIEQNADYQKLEPEVKKIRTNLKNSLDKIKYINEMIEKNYWNDLEEVVLEQLKKVNIDGFLDVLMKSDLFKKNILKNKLNQTLNFYKLFAEYRKKMSLTFFKNLIEVIKTCPPIYFPFEKYLYEICHEYEVKSGEKLNLSYYSAIIHSEDAPSFNNVRVFTAWVMYWLPLSSERYSDMEFPKNEIAEFTEKDISELLNYWNENLYRWIEPWKEIKQNFSSMSLLYDLLFNDQVQITSRSEAERFYQNLAVIRVLINVGIQRELTKVELKYIENINSDYIPYLGSEMNDFIDKYSRSKKIKDLKSINFTDRVEPSFKIIQEQPFLKFDNLTAKTDKEIEEFLIQNLENNDNVTDNQSIFGQAAEINEHRNDSEYIRVMHIIIKNKMLWNKYKHAVTFEDWDSSQVNKKISMFLSILDRDQVNENIEIMDIDLLGNIMEKYNNLNSGQKKRMDEIIIRLDFSSSSAEFLKDHPDEFEEIVDINYTFQYTFGRYFFEMYKNRNSFRSDMSLVQKYIVDKLQMLTIKEKQYFLGMFLPIIDSSEEIYTYVSLQGYLLVWQPVNKIVRKKFANVLKAFFSNYEPSTNGWINRSLAIMIADNSNFELTQVKWKKALTSQLIILFRDISKKDLEQNQGIFINLLKWTNSNVDIQEKVIRDYLRFSNKLTVEKGKKLLHGINFFNNLFKDNTFYFDVAFRQATENVGKIKGKNYLLLQLFCELIKIRAINLDENNFIDLNNLFLTQVTKLYSIKEQKIMNARIDLIKKYSQSKWQTRLESMKKFNI